MEGLLVGRTKKTRKKKFVFGYYERKRKLNGQG